MMQGISAEEERRRGQEAEQIFKHPLFIEACNALDAELRVLRERVPIRDTDMHTRIILAEQMHAKVLDYLRAVVMGGEAAQLILRERESLVERFNYAREHGLRHAF